MPQCWPQKPNSWRDIQVNKETCDNDECQSEEIITQSKNDEQINLKLKLKSGHSIGL